MVQEEYRKLRGRIIEKYGSNHAFAESMGLSDAQVSNKLSGKIQFTKKNIIEWAEKLEIAFEDYGEYFFT